MQPSPRRAERPVAGARLYLAWLVSVVATLGSLYFSEVRGFVPCTLCWYQRVLMYPMVILLGVASYVQDLGVRRYALPLSFLGIVVALYHVLEQNVPGFGAAGLCRAGVPCGDKYLNWLGFISIPVMSLTAFVLITALLLARGARASNADGAAA